MRYNDQEDSFEDANEERLGWCHRETGEVYWMTMYEFGDLDEADQAQFTPW